MRNLTSFFRKRNGPVFILGFVLLCVGLYVLWLTVLKNEDVEIVKTTNGFVPSRIIIDAGDSVTFSSVENSEFWPASDAHPTHGLLPGFDPKRALGSTETWGMTFTSPGVWSFHDHLDPQMKGQIIVRGKPGEVRDQCLKQRAETDLSPVCWEADVTDTLSSKGLSAAFTLVDSLYEEDPAFRRNCHDVMHILGAASFREFENAPTVVAEKRTSYCGYGFYHGFIETMLIENGNTNFESVKKYCTLVGEKISPSASGPCFHGIGHAIFDSLPGLVWGSADGMSDAALAICENVLETEDELAQCASGVYNSLANALSAGTYELSYAHIGSVDFCERQKTLYQKNCYAEVGTGYIREQKMDRETALEFIRTLKESVRFYQMFNYFADETKRMMHNLDIHALSISCKALTDVRESSSCIDGVLQGFRESTQVDKTHEVSLLFCGGLKGATLNRYCIQKAVETTPVIVRNSAAFGRLCVENSDSAHASFCKHP